MNISHFLEGALVPLGYYSELGFVEIGFVGAGVMFVLRKVMFVGEGEK